MKDSDAAEWLDVGRDDKTIFLTTNCEFPILLKVICKCYVIVSHLFLQKSTV